jgi:p-cumate 2,3-dioxygenase beta subunit
MTTSPATGQDRPALRSSSTALRLEIEEFLFEEAELLDQWRLHEWLEMVALECQYLVPATDKPDGDPTTDLFLIQDDRFLLEQRVNSLLTRSAHAEYPHSRTRRQVTNVRATDTGAGQIHVDANFSVYRVRTETFDTYVGHYRHLLTREADGTLRFVVRKAVLDLDALRPQGKVSIIL